MRAFRRASAAILAALALGALPPSYAATPWETYIQVPSAENARLVHEATYSRPADTSASPDRLEIDLRLLANQVRSRDSDAYDLALRLRHTRQLDGALAEFIDATVSEFLRIRPRAFLDGLKKYGSRRCDEAIYTDVDVFADRFSAHAYELRQRLAALESVDDAATSKLRDACEQSLRKALAEVEQAQAFSK